MTLPADIRVFAVFAQPGAEAFLRPALELASDQGMQVSAWRYGYDSGVTGEEIVRTGDESQIREDAELFGPNIIVTSLSYCPLERVIFDQARAAGVTLLQIADAWYDYRTRVEGTNGTGHFPDRLLVLDDRARIEAVGEGLPPDMPAVVGNPAWEGRQKLAAAETGRVLLVDQPLREDMQGRLGYDEWDFYQLVSQCQELSGSRSPEITVALHPRRAGHLPGLPPEWLQTTNARTALEECNLVLGMFSSFLIDAVLAGRHVVRCLPGGCEDGRNMLAKIGVIPTLSEPEGFAAINELRAGDYAGFARSFDNSRVRIVDLFLSMAGNGRLKA